MRKTILVCGHGPGISDAVAREFGDRGFAVALAARRGDRLSAAVEALGKRGIAAQGFPSDLSDPAGVAILVARVRASLGPLSVVHWNAFSRAAGDLTVASSADVRATLDVGVVGLIAAVQAALPDLKAHAGAVLVTGGGFAIDDARMDELAASHGSMGLAVIKAAQHKLVGVLGARLANDNVYVGEVMVTGLVKTCDQDRSGATIDPATVAARFWDLYVARTPRFAKVG